MLSSTISANPRNLHHALVSAPELQALLHPALGDQGASGLMPQVRQIRDPCRMNQDLARSRGNQD